MYNRNFMNNPVARAAAKLAVPRGARAGAVAGQMMPQPQRVMARQPGMPQLPQNYQQPQRFQQQLQVPQGGDAGVVAGCGDDSGCLSFPYGPPFAGLPLDPTPWLQVAALLPIPIVFPAGDTSVTIQASCGNSLFYGCCARSFVGPGEVGISEITSGSTSNNLICPGSVLDLNFFNTNGNECCCPFDFGCFSSFFPLIITFDLIGVPSVAPGTQFVVGGSRVEGGNACAFWPGLMGIPGAFPGAAAGGMISAGGMGGSGPVG